MHVHCYRLLGSFEEAEDLVQEAFLRAWRRRETYEGRDVRFSMPPTPGVWTGRSTVVQGWIDGGFGSEAFGSTRCVVTRANGQPAVAGYVRKPGDAAYEPLAIDVLRVQDGVVTEIVTFDGAVFEHFDLPATLGAAA